MLRTFLVLSRPDILIPKNYSSFGVFHLPGYVLSGAYGLVVLYMIGLPLAK